MVLIIFGILEWSIVHWLRRLFPKVRQQLFEGMGEGARGVISILLVGAVVLMVLGYRSADFVPVWEPPTFFTHINNLLMLLAFYCFGASAARPAKVWLGTKLRHPQLTGFKIWAVAHLLVNGDLASILLFGGLLAWAVISVILINKAEGSWTPPPQAPVKKEITLIVITLVLYALVSAVHIWLGVSPFGG
ncbi:NnrU family protein [Pseudaestuariivita sp.]|uniref:NnrU family protein n=1 Tax=Pseudaestuariivita sp. TaxID=2211669 RepID=UPI0040596199